MPEQGVRISFADPTKTTTFWVRCTQANALREVQSIASYHPSWFREAGLRAEYGVMDGDDFTPTAELDTSDIRF